jgi:hypothetical protein
MQTLFVQEAEDGFHLHPEYSEDEFPSIWMGLREALSKAFAQAPVKSEAHYPAS